MRHTRNTSLHDKEGCAVAAEPGPEQTGTTTTNIVGGGCLGCLGVVLVLLVGGWLWNQFGSRPETMTMQGKITISRRENMFVSGTSCAGRGDFDTLIGGNAITVWAERKSADVVELRPGVLTPAGTCVFRFTAEVEDAEMYEFRVDNLPDLTVRKSMFDTAGPAGETQLEVNLSWD